MSPSFIEANSLSGLNHLASNPPKYPRNPTEQQRASLVLYIARVPGTKDIILTTLKPQLKNVTSEDIASSLFYLHLNSEEDARLVPEGQPTPARTLSKSSKVPRKPLPPGSRGVSLDLDRQTALNAERPRLELATLDIHPEGTLEVDSAADAHVTKSPLGTKSNIARRPVGSQTPARANTVSRKPPEQVAPQSVSPNAGNPQTASPISGNQQASRRPRSSHTMFEFPRATEETGKAFSITIIRRDPTSGGQWNVGTVEGRSNPHHAKSTSSRKPYYDISVHITTPGYTYFRYPHVTPQPKHGGTVPSQGAKGVTSQLSGNEGPTSVAPKAVGAASGFHRQISMEWASSWNETFKQHRRAISDFSGHHSRSSSGSSQDVDPELHESEGSENSRARGYTFLSPWGGTCKFSTGGAGRSLRCRHRLPAPVSADTLSASSSSVCVSELRFNLPSADLFDTTKMNAAAIHVKNESSKISKKFENFRRRISNPKPQPSSETQPHPTSYAALYPGDEETRRKLPPRPSSISSDYEEQTTPLTEQLHSVLDELAITNDQEEDRLDLSIGQEKAGGGNRGKRVKLGKLVIHDEGLKMLDLIVAANIGVWWTIWDPS
ncbi:hypothetical protein CJF31_00008441 [Rutstroemia sp. NJR-2017a BVV2]|nr:hypothetical protein CJF31_00008441 [Rutstroemia sp. NJR-2017a BVV2]